ASAEGLGGADRGGVARDDFGVGWMASVSLGIVIGRRAARLALLRRGSGSSLQILFEHEIERPSGMSPAVAAERLLAALPRDLMPGRARISLASGDLACDDIWKAPEGLRSREVRAIAPILLEARAAGETLEGLSVDLT